MAAIGGDVGGGQDAKCPGMAHKSQHIYRIMSPVSSGSPRNWLDSTTQSGESLGAGGGPAAPRLIPALTVLFHRDPRQIGKRALLRELLAGQEAMLSRAEPLFGEAGNPQDRGAPLGDPRISRQPVCLTLLPMGGLRLRPSPSRTRLRYRGVEVEHPRDISLAELTEGGVLELGGAAALVLHLSREVQSEDEQRFALFGRSHCMQEVRTDIRRIADLDTPALILGETGTGKELVARALHLASRRAAQPFVAVNLGALPPSLAAAELFGAERGAFTGAAARQHGYFQQARGGTLFLDEIGEAPPEVQVMLLRAIETGEFRALGASAPYELKARIIAATDADLQTLIREKAFRAPLLHRLSACELRLPPLRLRREDLGQLVLHFLRSECAAQGRPFLLDRPDAETAPWLPLRLLTQLGSYDWPGNVRQLRNVVRQLVLASAESVSLELPPTIAEQLAIVDATPREVAPPPQPPAAAVPRRKPAELSEAELRAALEQHHWDLKATAQALAIARPSLYMLLDRFPQLRAMRNLTAEQLAQCYRDCGGNLDAMAALLHISQSALRRRLRECQLT